MSSYAFPHTMSWDPEDQNRKNRCILQWSVALSRSECLLPCLPPHQAGRRRRRRNRNRDRSKRRYLPSSPSRWFQWRHETHPAEEDLEMEPKKNAGWAECRRDLERLGLVREACILALISSLAFSCSAKWPRDVYKNKTA